MCHKYFFKTCNYLERRFANQTLVDDRAYAPEVGFGVIVL